MNPQATAQPLALTTASQPADDAATSTAMLTRGIAAGDRDAFAMFYAQWFERVLLAARRLTRREEAECLDIVHDVMLKVVHRMVALADERALDAWMAKAILTTVLDRRRAEQRRRRRETTVALHADAVSEPDAVAAALLHDERIRWLRRELDGLPRREREAVLARFVGDRSFAELGRVLGISGDAAAGRVRRTLLWLARRAREVFGHV